MLNKSSIHKITIDGGKRIFAQWIYDNTHYIVVQDERGGLTTAGIYESKNFTEYNRISTIESLSGVAYKDYAYSTSNGIFFFCWSDDGGDCKSYYSVDSGRNWIPLVNKYEEGWLAGIPLLEYKDELYYFEQKRQPAKNTLIIKKIDLKEFKLKQFAGGEIVTDITSNYTNIPTVETDKIWYGSLLNNNIYIYCKGITYRLNKNDFSIILKEERQPELVFPDLPISYNNKIYFHNHDTVFYFDENKYDIAYKNEENDFSNITDIFMLKDKLYFKKNDKKFYNISKSNEVILIDEDSSNYLGNSALYYNNYCISLSDSIIFWTL